jgi:hypothetical protein
MKRYTELQTSRIAVAPWARLAFGCLLLASTAAAAPATATCGRAVSSASESPLENDSDPVEVAMPRIQTNHFRPTDRRSGPASSGPRLDRCAADTAERPGIANGHRLTNGLTAPLRC